MSRTVSPLAGQSAPKSLLIDIAALVAAYHDRSPDPTEPGERVSFGTSGHRGTSVNGSFNADHVLAITQALCDFRRNERITGPLFLGIDTHALSAPAAETAQCVLAANEVELRIAAPGEYTPTPAVSHAILSYNRGRQDGLADGIVMTPSHNPPGDGGYKYNPSHGGPADSAVTEWIGARANAYLEQRLAGVRHLAVEAARVAPSTRHYDFLTAYVADLGAVIDFDAIRGSGLRMAVDPVGGAGVRYWPAIAERYRLDLTVLNEGVDPQFAFAAVDWDGQIRMDPSSAYAMASLVALKDRFDVAFACDTDHDRHGVVAASCGLMPANHYLSVLADYLLAHRPAWPATGAIGKTVVTTAMLERVAARAGREVYEVPVGFKWLAPGLHDATLVFGCEESAGASLLRRDGTTWTTDKDGIAPALLAGEVMARMGRDPGELYSTLENTFGAIYADRIEAAANPAQKRTLAALTPDALNIDTLAGEALTSVISRAPGNGEPIGGIKVSAADGWFAARPSGTEDLYKIYAESFRDRDHLARLLTEAQQVVDRALAGAAGDADGQDTS